LKEEMVHELEEEWSAFYKGNKDWLRIDASIPKGKNTTHLMLTQKHSVYSIYCV
jgi:hypothetical protein